MYYFLYHVYFFSKNKQIQTIKITCFSFINNLRKILYTLHQAFKVHFAFPALA